MAAVRAGFLEGVLTNTSDVAVEVVGVVVAIFLGLAVSELQRGKLLLEVVDATLVAVGFRERSLGDLQSVLGGDVGAAVTHRLSLR